VLSLKRCATTNMKEKINLDGQVRQAKSRYHWMPCEVEHTGSAPVTAYFEPNISEQTVAGSAQLIGSFRGRPLLGSQLTLPDGFTGLVLKSGRLDDEPTLRPTERVAQLIHWNWDQASTSSSSAHQALDWCSVSEQLHRPVTREQIQKFKNDLPKSK
jgi:ribonuclease H2 subunit C